MSFLNKILDIEDMVLDFIIAVVLLFDSYMISVSILGLVLLFDSFCLGLI